MKEEKNRLVPENITIHELIDIVVTILDARDPYTMEHSFRVAEYAETIAGNMDLDPNTLQKIHVAAHFHDIGKIGIPDTILNQPGRLMPEEIEAIQSHPRFGYNILKRLPALQGISEMVLYHHERYDGKGYPEGISGAQIPLGSRIIAVADAFDAMTSDRPYRKAMTAENARKEILHQTGRQFCPSTVHHFCQVFPLLAPSAFSGGMMEKKHFAFIGHEELMKSRMRLSDSDPSGRSIRMSYQEKEIIKL